MAIGAQLLLQWLAFDITLAVEDTYDIRRGCHASVAPSATYSLAALDRIERATGVLLETSGLESVLQIYVRYYEEEERSCQKN